jgi:leader peptidase (prepilin peptidase)/N-methyltransferase
VPRADGDRLRPPDPARRDHAAGNRAGLALSFVPSSGRRSRRCGAALGAGGLFLVAFAYEKIAGHEGMGLGDVKMLGMVGAFLGPAGVLVTILAASSPEASSGSR